MTCKIAPSILSANFLHLEDEIRAVEKAGADILHLDIMDGHFVPNLTFGPGLVKQVRRTTNLPLDAHLMITNPADFIDKFIDAGVNYLSFHIETDSNYKELFRKIRKQNVKVGIAINPETSLAGLSSVLDEIDYVLIMSVHPGFGGQSYIYDSAEKARETRDIIGNRNIEIEIDGGINFETAKLSKEAGVNILVAGSFIFKSEDYQYTIQGLRNV
ncbi:MAG TPA: ribulose-phosphate 3-epimerase [Candidatus Cloacimonetes bacterium]|nr:ribulose-phosphate 3-epimerase [Candidatus Cloacimonadota bacterium]HEX38418.1 ribulose-phosphate 3-epimerase [Candidatus Cloacimonadota bacterium]